LEKCIRRQKTSEKEDKVQTQAGQLMRLVLEGLEKECDVILVTIDMSAINSNVSPGVSYPSVVGGLTVEEVKEISFLVGANKKVRIIGVSEFNPAVEAKKTATLAVEIYYEFVRGFSTR
jgi:arginase family enzyme